MPPKPTPQQNTSGQWYFMDRPSVFYSKLQEALMADRDMAFVADTNLNAGHATNIAKLL